MVCFKNVERFCKDYTKIENYEIAVNSLEIYACHHRLETHTSDGERRLVDISKQELITLGMYYNRPPEELVFMQRDKHTSLHCKNKKLSETTKAKISAAIEGRKLSETTKAKLSASMKGKNRHPMSDEMKAKISASLKGKKGHPMSDEMKAKISASLKGNTNVRGKKWYNNRYKNIRSFSCPEGYIPGRLSFKED